MNETTPATIRTDNLCKRYRRVQALDHLNLEVPRGAIYALVGPNGAGKTTAIKIFMNIFRATSGTAEVLGTDSKKIAGRAFERIGYVSENQELPLWMTVATLLDYLRPFYPTWDRDLEKELVRNFELPLDRKLKALSRGMRMKAALAGSLAYRPPLIVMDEPFSGLDPLVRDEFMEGLLEQAGEMTILISSHELAEIDGVATHVAFLDEGKLLFQESMSDLMGRFREVHVTLEAEAAEPRQTPKEWMQMRTIGNVLTFVDTRFDENGLGERVRSRIEGVRGIDAQPMPLRSIFTTLARAARDGAA